MKRKLLLLAMLCMASFSLIYGQGVTTSRMNGRVVDANGEGLPGATVIAVHVPTGSQYGNVTDPDGYFRIPNMNVGGPYTITISFVGYQSFEKPNVYLTLGQTLKLDATLSEDVTELEGVEIVANRNDIFDGNRTGQETVVNEQTINALPTLARRIGDFARFNPQANIQEGSDGFTISLGGMNNRFNAIFIDGAVNNDVFGLAGSGTNGGQAGASPISIDAIEQFQIAVAPFDVRQSGFAGGSISAVTRSGTNEFEGSAYYLVRNENFAGKTPVDDESLGIERTKLDEFSAKTYGVRVGGPIVKNKAFFFFNAEVQRDETPLPFDFATYQGDATIGDINSLISHLNGLGYDPGPFDQNEAFTNAERFLVKFDFNLGSNHKLAVRHSYTNIENLEGVQSNTRNIRFLNSSELFPSTTNSTSIELKSTLGDNKSNHLTLGYTSVRDDRDPSGADFPYVSIADGPGTITFGSERFSTANALDQDIFTITNNFEIYKGKHTITIGTHNEFYDVYNLFIPFNFGSYEYERNTPIGNSNLEDFINGENSSFFIRSFSLRDNIVGDGSVAAAEFNGMQLGFYVQDEFQVSDKLKLTGGVRIDVPIWPDDTPANSDFNSNAIPAMEGFGYDLGGAQVGKFIDPQVMFAPRLGFNYDLQGNQTTQIRGGIGVFNSRIPLVWPGGSYNNTGLNRGTDLRFGDLPFTADPRGQFQSVQPGSGSPSGDIDLFVDDFKYPQVMKLNLAVDHKLPWGLIGTVEGLYTDFINNILYQNVNIKPTQDDGSPLPRLTGTPDNRPLYNDSDRIDGTYGRVLLASNTSEGYAYTITAQVQKPFENGLTASVAYTYGDAFSVFDGTSSQNSSQWRGLHSVQGRNFTSGAQRSDFSQGSRVIAQVSYRKEYAGFGASQISLFYNGQSGRPFSYIYNDGGNLNNEDSRERNLIYVPANASEIILIDDGSRTAAQQWAELDAFIASDDYLSERRGQYAERNQSRSPFENIIDLRFLQDFYLEMGNGKRNTIQFSLDIFNFTNLLNKDWGRRYNAGSFGNFELLNFEGFQADGTTPEFTFDGVKNNEPWADNIVDSGFRSARWQMQVGVRYIFGN